MMFHLDLIPLICDYLLDYRHYLINKNAYKIIINKEKDNYWKFKYDNFFINLKKEYLILNGDYNWKRQYLKVKRFKYWSKIDNPYDLFLCYCKIKEIPKEIINLTILQCLYLHNNEIKEITIGLKEICNLTNLQYLYLHSNQIKEIQEL